MNNKVIIKLIVPRLDSTYDVFIPINKKVSTIVYLLSKSINEITNGDFVINDYIYLYNKDTKEVYNMETIIKNTNIRNGSELILL